MHVSVELDQLFQRQIWRIREVPQHPDFQCEGISRSCGDLCKRFGRRNRVRFGPGNSYRRFPTLVIDIPVPDNEIACPFSLWTVLRNRTGR